MTVRMSKERGKVGMVNQEKHGKRKKVILWRVGAQRSVSSQDWMRSPPKRFEPIVATLQVQMACGNGPKEGYHLAGTRLWIFLKKMRDFVPEKPVPSHSHISSAIFRCTTQCYSFRKCIGLTTTFLDITYVREITRMLSYSKHQLPAARCSGCAWAEWRKNKRDRTERGD